MAEKLSLTEARAFLAGELKKTLAVHTERMETIRKREQKSLDKKASKLAKAEKECKGCGKKFDSVSATPSEYCGGCNRKPKDESGKVRKGGDLVTTPDSGMPSSMGMSEKMGKNAQAGYGPDGQDLSLSEDEHEGAECPACGGEGNKMGALGKRVHYRCRDCGSVFSNGKTDHRERDHAFDSSGKAKSTKKTELGKAEMCKSCGKPGGLCKCDMSEVKPGKDVAKAAKAELEKGDAWMDGVKRGKSVKKDEKSVVTANKELKGFKSLATNPTAPFKTKQGAMVKDELPAVKAAPAKKVPGAKLPGMPKKVDTTEGSGGDVKKGLKKGAMDVALGMQKPVPHDPMAVHNLKLPGMKQTPPPVPKVNGMHPATASSLHAVGVGMHPDTRQSLAALPKPPTAPKGVVGVGGKQPVGMGGGDAHKIAPPPIPAAARKDEMPAAAPVKQMMHPNAAKMGLAADKRNAGIGLVNNIRASLSPAASNPGSFEDRSPAIQAVRKQRSPYAGVRGMAALARGEVKPGEKVPEKKGVLAVKPSPLQRGLSMTNHNRRVA